MKKSEESTHSWSMDSLARHFLDTYSILASKMPGEIMLIKITRTIVDEMYYIRLASERDNILVPRGLAIMLWTDSQLFFSDWLLTLRELMGKEDGLPGFDPYTSFYNDGENILLIENTPRPGCRNRRRKYLQSIPHGEGRDEAKRLWDAWCNEAEGVSVALDGEEESQS
jgi:hypothetical protein